MSQTNNQAKTPSKQFKNGRLTARPLTGRYEGNE